MGWPELGMIVVLAILILGPKELPTAMRTIAKWVKRIRGMAREFQGHLDDVVREAELQEVRDGLNKAKRMDLGREIEKEVDPTGEFTKDLNDARKDLDLKSVPRQTKTAAENRPTEDPARPIADAAEPVEPAKAPSSPSSASPDAREPEPASASTEPNRSAGGEKGA
ncbi:Twin-arginine translocation protein TatB [Caenispirillum salinarum AK4]|uniref:Twin-arginine translocation protein TatB n=1 Tax=Caenispirillum salinarum AK4 TaxID=1238182 RepID=K9H058_9PROT|nr:Twin-arginine translocation protein TatB [Caenispirillum salinarum AK4]